MQQTITSLALKYSLPEAEIMANIETFFSTILSRWYSKEIMVVLRADLQLEAVGYDNSGGMLMQKPVNLRKIKKWGAIEKHLEHHLAKAAVLKHTVCYKTWEGELLWGEVYACDANNNLYVQTEVIPGKQITAVCPLNRIGCHERRSNAFAIGNKRAFHLRLVEPVLISGTPRLKVIVDRTSKTLVKNLLKEQLEKLSVTAELCCINRYVGHKSMVLTTKPIPKAAILAVDRELKERVQVEIVRTLPGR